MSAIQEVDPNAEAESTQNSATIRNSGCGEQSLLSPHLKFSDGDRTTSVRPSPAQLQNQQKLINVIQSALADHDALLDNFFSQEGNHHRRGSQQANASQSFNCKPRCSHDVSENRGRPEASRRLLFEKAQPDGEGAARESDEEEGVYHPLGH